MASPLHDQMCMTECMVLRRRYLLVQRLAFAAVVSLAAGVSGCGRDMPTGPDSARGADVRIQAEVRGISAQATPPSFDHARFVFRRVTGAVALDTTIAIGDGTSSASAHFAIPLAVTAPATGEILTLFLSCMSQSGDIVYFGGPALVYLSPFGNNPPVTVILQPAGSGLPTDSLPVVGTAVGLVMSTVGSVVEAGVPIASQIVVQAVDATGALVTSFTGSVSLLLGGGPSGALLGGTTTAQAAGGIARFTGITLTRAGTGYTLLASAPRLTSATSSPFSVTPSSPASIATAGGDGQTGVVGALLGTPLKALVADRFGNPVPGTTVAWAVAAGGGILGSATSVTDASGIASNTLHLGQAAGLNQVSATVSGVAPLLFNLTATASGAVTSVATSITAVSGDGQSGVVGSLLGAPLRALVKDQNGNPMPGQTVGWVVALGGGLLASPTSVTDASGIASNALRLGLLPGLNQVTATTGGLVPAIFKLTGIL